MTQPLKDETDDGNWSTLCCDSTHLVTDDNRNTLYPSDSQSRWVGDTAFWNEADIFWSDVDELAH